MVSLMEYVLAAGLFLQVVQVVLLSFILRSSLSPYVNQELLKNVRDLKSSLWRLEGRAWRRDEAVPVAAPASGSRAPLLADAPVNDGDGGRSAHPAH